MAAAYVAGCLTAALAVGGSIVALGGIAKYNKSCTDYGSDPKYCSDVLSNYWWGISFCVVLSVVILVLVALRKTVLWTSTLQVEARALCVACASVSMENVARMYNERVLLDSGRYYYSRTRMASFQDRLQSVNVSFAGFLLQSFALLALIIALGVVNSHHARRVINNALPMCQ
ncbi:hypothetical protein VOLCADRAFT_105433 [Volvox carteri f. nagariensis]|uniref:Uncharacterized protein n=1 Tax=Volvox carteri f. nagariensis TaxID=3068 RepID=D8U0S0_VOLCA|nr:uncharacterized protein VOLCADRAFT_105433 [Volvox carteri f. nagariensis]EFJ46687.1 hypothetical protein VOLCADRAFT_105433 [Volvox carteri f. nagariensis]|eukprot:XP_002952216.1 hypothetical protein VOLCADRAFT_105433 [Volvox carteri f. nagariensis]